MFRVFVVDRTSIYGTAVCVYNMAAIQAAFEGPFKYQENPEMAWGRKPNINPHMQVTIVVIFSWKKFDLMVTIKYCCNYY